MVMQTSTCFPTISNRGRAMRFDKVLFAGMAPKPQPALDASDYQQKLQQRERGLAWKHCRDLGGFTAVTGGWSHFAAVMTAKDCM